MGQIFVDTGLIETGIFPGGSRKVSIQKHRQNNPLKIAIGLAALVFKTMLGRYSMRSGYSREAGVCVE